MLVLDALHVGPHGGDSVVRRHGVRVLILGQRRRVRLVRVLSGAGLGPAWTDGEGPARLACRQSGGKVPTYR